MPVNKDNFHAILCLTNGRNVFAKLLVGELMTILKNKKKLRNLRKGDKERFRSDKIYGNESLCPTYKRLFRKCNLPP